LSYNPDHQDEEDQEEPIYDFRPSKWEYERRKESKEGKN